VRATPTPRSAPTCDLLGEYAGSCDAGEGQLSLRADSTFLLSLAAARGGARWTLRGRWIDAGGTEESPAGAGSRPLEGPLRFFALECHHWSLHWSTAPGLRPADLGIPPLQGLLPLHAVDARGRMCLNAYEPFLLSRRPRDG
jgi:hypothetical protein